MKLFFMILLINFVIFITTFIICACKLASDVDDIIELRDYKRLSDK